MLVAVAGMAFWAAPSVAQAKTIKVAATGSTTSIQNAIEAAAPGDTVSVAPGTYTGPTVRVTKSDLTISGSVAATIDATGNDFGITVGPGLGFEPGPPGPGFT